MWSNWSCANKRCKNVSHLEAITIFRFSSFNHSEVLCMRKYGSMQMKDYRLVIPNRLHTRLLHVWRNRIQSFSGISGTTETIQFEKNAAKKAWQSHTDRVRWLNGTCGICPNRYCRNRIPFLAHVCSSGILETQKLKKCDSFEVWDVSASLYSARSIGPHSLGGVKILWRSRKSGKSYRNFGTLVFFS